MTRLKLTAIACLLALNLVTATQAAEQTADTGKVIITATLKGQPVLTNGCNTKVYRVSAQGKSLRTHPDYEVNSCIAVWKGTPGTYRVVSSGAGLPSAGRIFQIYLSSTTNVLLARD
jgi:hypothetical protein